MVSEKSLQSVGAEETKKCPECGSKDLVRRSGEMYCKKCGFVIEE